MWFLAGDVLNSKVEFAVSPGQELMDPGRLRVPASELRSWVGKRYV